MTNSKNVIALFFIFTFGCYKDTESTEFKIFHQQGGFWEIKKVKNQEDLEYPRGDKRILKILSDKWENYYDCLRSQIFQQIKPEIRRLSEGQFTEFLCTICPKPFETYEDIIWKYKPILKENNNQDLAHLDIGPGMTMTNEKTLKIFNVVHDLEGLYVCYQKKNVISVYLLEISKNDTIEKQVEESQVSDNHIFHINNNYYQIHYQWGPWSECSRCDKVGKMYKYGHCFISKPRDRRSIKENITNTTPAEDDETSNSQMEWNWIEKFSIGVPCYSQYLPKLISEFLKQYSSIKAVVRYCRKPCETSELFTVINDKGEVLEVANNSAGIYSVFQNLPHIPVTTERRSISAESGGYIIIQCPSTLLTTAPVQWKLGKRIIFPELISRESRGRIMIDLVNRIHIKRLRLRDSLIYSCWQKGKLAGTINLSVQRRFKIRLNHHVTLMVIFFAIVILLLIGTQLISRELKN